MENIEKPNHAQTKITGPIILLFLLLGFQWYLVLAYGARPRPLSGDEKYYVNKATHISKNGFFYRGNKTSNSDVSIGTYSDFRPPGYPAYLALLGINKETYAERFRVVTICHLLLISGALLLVLQLIFRLTSQTRITAFLCAFVLGIQPYLFEFSANYLSDVLNMALFFLGSYLLIRTLSENKLLQSLLFSMLSGFLLGYCILLRPEMILFSFIVILTVVVFALFHRKSIPSWFFKMLPAVVLCGIFSISYFGYYYYHSKTLYPPYVRATPGLNQWMRTWTHFERISNHIHWNMLDGAVSFEQIPERAFGDKEEKKRVQNVIKRIRESGTYTKEDDAVFSAIAKKREQNFLRNVLLPRVIMSVNLWINEFSNPYWLSFMSDWRYPIRLAALAFFIGLRILLVIGAVGGFFVLFSRLSRKNTFIRCLLWLSLIVFLTRTAFFGFVMARNEHRYVYLCWPFVLIVALSFYSMILSPKPKVERI